MQGIKSIMMLIYICVPFGGSTVHLMKLKKLIPLAPKKEGQGAQKYKN